METDKTNKETVVCKLLIIVGVLFDAAGSFIVAFVILFENDINVFNIKTLPLSPLSLYLIAALFIFVGIGISLIGIKRE